MYFAILSLRPPHLHPQDSAIAREETDTYVLLEVSVSGDGGGVGADYALVLKFMYER